MMIKILRPVFRLFPRTIKEFIYLCLRASSNYLKGYPTLKNISFNKHHDEVHVLGNGPSMRMDKSYLLQYVGVSDFYCVNNFCDDDSYTKFKPVCYFFLDEYFFSDRAHRDWVTRRENTFNKINELTDWDMQIFIPSFANKEILKEHIKRKNIDIIKLDLSSTELTMDKLIDRIALASGLYTPPCINVLIYAIFFAVWAGYKKVNVWGADLSFHKDVDVNQANNDLVMHVRHFNEVDKFEVLKKNPEKIEKWKMSELLDLSAKTFNAHEVINAFAKTRGIRIVNRSHYSLIDAYERTNEQLNRDYKL